MIFTSAKIGDLELPNRIIRAGCFEGMAFEGRPSKELIDYHTSLAAGGVAMTTLAYCAVSPEGRAYHHELWMRKEIIPDLRKFTGSVHARGAAASIQLGHCGFFADMGLTKTRAVAPSRKFCTFRLAYSRAMDETDIERVKDAFVSAASMAKESGFDAVELHAGHGYLLSQFLSPWTNGRRDRWGGDLAGRLRFPLHVLRGIKEKIPDLPVIVKMNVEDGFKGGLALGEAAEVAKAFEREGADALVPSCGFTARTPFYMLRGKVPISEFIRNRKALFMKAGLFLFGKLMVKEYEYKEAFLLEEAKRIKDAVKIPVALIGGMTGRRSIENGLKAGFQFVQIGRALVMDNDFAARLKAGSLEESECDHCNRCVASMDAGAIRCVTKDERIKSLQ